MDWQQISALVIVALTAALLVRSQVRRSRRGMLSSCDGCSCRTPVPDGANDPRREGGTS